MKKSISCVLFIVLLISIMLVANTNPVKSQNTITVPDDFATIQEAINNANEGDTIFVRNGTYYEHIIIDKALTLFGENRDISIISGSGASQDVVTVASDNVSIAGFTITSAGLHSSAVSLGKYADINTTVAHNCSIFGNNIVNNYYGVKIPNSGIIEEITSNNVSDNNFINNTVGLELGVDGNLNTVLRNKIVSNNIGISIRSSNNTIYGNHIALNSEGIYFCGSEVNNAVGNLIMRNEILNNQKGFFPQYIGGLLLNSNFPRADLSFTDENCIVYQNTFMSNVYQVYIDPWEGWGSHLWDNGHEGNYWSDYTGSDLNGDGIGDVPYTIDSSGRDNYPLMNPYMLGDINHDAVVDIFDVVKIAVIFGCSSADPQYNPHCDVNEDNLIDIFDLATVAVNFGKEWASP